MQINDKCLLIPRTDESSFNKTIAWIAVYIEDNENIKLCDHDSLNLKRHHKIQGGLTEIRSILNDKEL
uniref:Uncharacterized protein n=1 Tax=Rhizophagus irregularis (strain DAOM 181602 / DAOM 197198 / MUCL 43194) TaxID=747089 RepID=U9TM49_RHIID